MQEVEGITLAEGLILNYWDMGKAQGLRSKDKLVELHMLLTDMKKLVWERTGKSSDCLGISERVKEAVFDRVINKKWKINIVNLGADQILMGKTGDEAPIYYSCITIHNLEEE